MRRSEVPSLGSSTPVHGFGFRIGATSSCRLLLLDAGRVLAPQDATGMTPQAPADWLAQWPK